MNLVRNKNQCKRCKLKIKYSSNFLFGGFFSHTLLLEVGKCALLQQVRRTIFQRIGWPKWWKKSYAIRFTNFLITAPTMVGCKGARRLTLFCGISLMKEQVSNQEKGFFYLNSKQADLWPCVFMASAALHGSISTSTYGMKGSYIKRLPLTTDND